MDEFFNLSTLYFNEFATIAVIHLLAVISPGPDFIVVIKQCNFHGRKSALITSFGIALGILVHVSYCIIGIGLLIANNYYLMNSIKIIGAIYLFYIGVCSLYSSNKLNKVHFNFKYHDAIVNRNSFFLGLVTNLFNPKATLFFLSIFSLLINNSTPIIIKSFYGIWMSFVTGFWFCLVSLFFTSKFSQIFISKYSLIIDKIMGIILIAISTKLILF